MKALSLTKKEFPEVFELIQRVQEGYDIKTSTRQVAVHLIKSAAANKLQDTTQNRQHQDNSLAK